jgi:hypothetical protein
LPPAYRPCPLLPALSFLEAEPSQIDACLKVLTIVGIPSAGALSTELVRYPSIALVYENETLNITAVLESVTAYFQVHRVILVNY